MNSYILLHSFVILLSALALWLMRRELVERPASFIGWMTPPVISLFVAFVLLVVSPGKRFELWAIAIVVGLAAGVGMGCILKATKDYERVVVKIGATIDGVAASALLLLLAIGRLVTSDLMNRPSGKFGVLGAAASFLACYLFARAIAIWFYNAPQSIHLDMTEDGHRKAG